jgi:hypothetical protein
MTRSLANHEIVTIAVFLLGGDRKSVDTEDAAIKAHELAPGRFSWVKYTDKIDREAVRKRLWDAKKPEHGGYLIGSDRKGWMLTAKGLEFAKAQLPHMKTASLSRTRMTAQEANWVRRERARLLMSEAFAKYTTRGAGSISTSEAERLLRLGDYVVGDARQQRLTRILNLFGDDPELGPFLRHLTEALVPQRMTNGTK